MYSSTPIRKSTHYAAFDKSAYKSSNSNSNTSSRSPGNLGISYDGSKPVNSPITDRQKYKRKSYGSALPFPSTMSKSDTTTYKTASKTLRGTGKGTCSKVDGDHSVMSCTSVDTEIKPIPHNDSRISSSLTSSNGASTLLSSSFLSKVRIFLKSGVKVNSFFVL